MITEALLDRQRAARDGLQSVLDAWNSPISSPDEIMMLSERTIAAAESARDVIAATIKASESPAPADDQALPLKAALIDLLVIIQRHVPSGGMEAERSAILNAMRLIGIADTFSIIDRFAAITEPPR